MSKLSAIVTCFNNEETILQCVESLSCADEVIVLDSFSTDSTIDILKSLNCTVHQQKFRGYAQQKQDAINIASNSWVVLLDSDEFLSKNAIKKILKWKQSIPKVDAYTLPRLEWVFWKWSHSWVHKNNFIRLFDRKCAKVSQAIVHESIHTTGSILPLNAIIKHRGETSITLKVDKINRYSQLAAQQKFQQGQRVSPLKIVFYPLWYFFRQYFIRRQIFNGWAGIINAYLNTKYAFLKYAKLYELQKNKN